MKDDLTLDGLPVVDWLARLQQTAEPCKECMSTTTEDDWLRFTRERDTEPPTDPIERWPTLTAIGLDEAIDAMERVCTWAQKGKHRGKKWESQTAEHQIAKLLGHLSRGMKGDVVDEETGEHAYTHTAVRALMLLGIALKEQQK